MLGTKMIVQRNELVNQIKDGSLLVEEAKASLAGWLLKDWVENGIPGIITHNLTPQESAYYNAASSIEMGLED